MSLSDREKLELMRQGIIRGFIIPQLEERGYLVSYWKRPISLEDMYLRDDGWKPLFSRFTSWETYKKDYPLYLFFNTFYGDVYEKAYKNCFVEYILNILNYDLASSLVGIFTRLNVSNGYYWKHRIPINLSVPESCVRIIDATYDELIISLAKDGLLDEIERMESGDHPSTRDKESQKKK
ncbi:MAG: hypothetical protein NZ929_06105 [Aigarchaeota archaeon]|nr:hypothetical protein [Aigarchaeota archaeon]MCX8192556.1 hypothetical protein [Nitrososphaeria archaeon]MDW7985708.1 hypothetical protein [Nitrososphaerota archaeon]